MTLHQCHLTKEVYVEVYSNDLRDYTATHHANAWYIMGRYYWHNNMGGSNYN
jgi:hypothetical protein